MYEEICGEVAKFRRKSWIEATQDVDGEVQVLVASCFDYNYSHLCMYHPLGCCLSSTTASVAKRHELSPASSIGKLPTLARVSDIQNSSKAHTVRSIAKPDRQPKEQIARKKPLTKETNMQQMQSKPRCKTNTEERFVQSNTVELLVEGEYYVEISGPFGGWEQRRRSEPAHYALSRSGVGVSLSSSGTDGGA